MKNLQGLLCSKLDGTREGQLDKVKKGLLCSKLDGTREDLLDKVKKLRGRYRLNKNRNKN